MCVRMTAAYFTAHGLSIRQRIFGDTGTTTRVTIQEICGGFQFLRMEKAGTITIMLIQALRLPDIAGGNLTLPGGPFAS